MNQLSVILYFADVSTNVMGMLNSIGLFLIIGFLSFNLVRSIVVGNHNYNNEYCNGDNDYLKHGFVYTSWIIIGLFMIVISNFIPSKQTMYMIASSEIGETVILSPEMTETMGKVKTFVDLQLDDMISELTDDNDKSVVENK